MTVSPMTLPGVCSGRTDSPLQSFNNLLSSIGSKPEAPVQQSPNHVKPPSTQPDRKPNGLADRFKLTPSNGAAGVKRRSEEPETVPKAKFIKTEPSGASNRPAAASSRFQLSAKPNGSAKTLTASQRPGNAAVASHSPQRAVPKHAPKPNLTNTPTPPGSSDGASKPKRGFASILEKAKAAQAVSAAAGMGGYKHKPVEKLTKRERLKRLEEAKAQAAAAAAKKRGPGLTDRSRSGTPADTAQKATYQGTMKKREAEALAYRGTMRAAGSHLKATPKKGPPQGKYGGYVSWSDLDDAEEEEEGEGGYDSLSDMEAGLDDVELEEAAALRAAKTEDQAALEEEGRLKREKLERKRKLEALAARKKR